MCERKSGQRGKGWAWMGWAWLGWAGLGWLYMVDVGSRSKVHSSRLGQRGFHRAVGALYPAVAGAGGEVSDDPLAGWVQDGVLTQCPSPSA